MRSTFTWAAMSATRFVTGLLISVTACVHGFSLTPGPIKLYEGPDLPITSVALIENDRNMFLESVDGRSLRRWSQTRDVLTIQVLPGKHAVVAGPSVRAGVISTDGVRLEFGAAPGRRYTRSLRLT